MLDRHARSLSSRAPRWLRYGGMLLLAGALAACGRTSTVGGQHTVTNEQDCQNGLDDDVDGLLDCQDPDCGSDPYCFGGNENCGNGKDDDGDGLIDCLDPDCKSHPLCTTPGPEDCVNKRDDDGDTLIDCQDPDCALHPACLAPGQENCTNGRDDDGDGLVDCQDPDCVFHPACVKPGQENCVNGVDDDGDGLVDCQDPDCVFHPACVKPGQENCVNGVDDDGDNLVDCQDPDCAAHPACVKPGQENCVNGADDDGDGLVDCQDPDCFTHPACVKPGQENCTNKIDDDNDNLIDCKDPDCAGHPACGPSVEICVNLKDDDGDGKTDCDDSDCKGHPACIVLDENCTNKLDDDGDGLIDCKDPDCLKHPDCTTPGAEICNNNVDDDSDGDIDCADSDCKGLPICLGPGNEVCDNGKDDDGDGATDCDDPDCKSFPACVTLLCKPTVDFGTINPTGSKVTRSFDARGRPDVYTSPCVIPGGGEVVGRFRLSAAADVKLAYDQKSGDHAFALFRAGTGQACNANHVDCFDPESAKSGDFSIKGLAAGDYFIIVEAFATGLAGEVDLTLSTGNPVTKENCKNGIDDDGDGAIDCADLDCVFTPGCTTQNCKVDVNLGSLVINGPSKQVTVNTATGGDDVDEKCAAGGGGDIVIRLVMPQAGGVNVTVNQQGWHTFGMHRDKGPGTTCTADTGSCFDSNSTPGFIIEYGSVEKGVYYYVVEALNKTSGGTVSLSFKAFQPRGPELCANGIDDDADGLIDCLDPDCTGVVGCPGPVCTPDYKGGALVIGAQPVTFQLDTTTANNDQTVSCALGGGKDEVVEFELTKVSGLRVNCNQFSGDQVLGLFAAGAPRDPCDQNQINCADPKTGSLGCSFIFPNLQPGKYYLVVEAFQPGKEGRMQLSLSATPDHAQEICNNGKDDDGDGLIDCKDANCSTKPICQGKTCTPDQKVGLIVKGGQQQNIAVTTTGAGDGVAASCANGGGEDAVVGFTLAELANLQIDFAQFGNHVVAIYEDKGTGFACDAAPVACQPTNGQATGKVQFSALKPGQYFLVLEASAGGSEGSVVMQVRAK
jgi:hypothetical protein